MNDDLSEEIGLELLVAAVVIGLMVMVMVWGQPARNKSALAVSDRNATVTVSESTDN